MKTIKSLLIFALSLNLWAQQKSDLPFQVLIAKNASIYGTPVQPLQMVDDVTSIDVDAGGFLSLVHKGGTTYEYTEKIFTFYLKPHQLKNRHERPRLDILYMDSTIVDPTNGIILLSPVFDSSDYIEWNESEPFDIYWHLRDEPVLNYLISVVDSQGAKIQDFRSRLNKYTLKPATYGLADGLFTFKVSSTFDGETIESKSYSVQLKTAPLYEKKASDLVLLALDLELNPPLALDIWKEVMTMPNGNFYIPLFKKFLIRNEEVLTAAGEDVQQLLSQNK